MSKDVILRKLDLITAELNKLKSLANLSLEDYLKDFTNYYSGERIIEKIVGAAIDINISIVTSKGEKVPDTYYDSFLMMAKLNIFPLAFARQIADSARLRNKIVHNYEEIEEEQIYQSLEEAVTQYAEYVRYIHRYLEKE